MRQHRYEDATVEALDAVGLEHMTPLGHHLLGVALALRGEREQATLAFDTALSFAPGLAIAHRWLVRIHSRPGGDIGKASFHRAQLHVLRKKRSAHGDAKTKADSGTGINAASRPN